MTDADPFHDHETEQAILGAALNDPSTATAYLLDERLTDQHFATEPHQTLWRFIGHYIEHGTGDLSSIALTATLESHPDLIVGRHLPQEITLAAGACTTNPHANGPANPEHARKLRDTAERRRVANLTRNAHHELRDLATPPEDIAARLASRIADERLDTDPRLTAETTDGILIADAIENAIPQWETDQTRRYTPTGIHALDQVIGGLEPGRLVTLAARPAMGKSVLALMISARFAETTGHVLHWSLEMAPRELAERYVAMTGATTLPALTKHDPRAWRNIDWGRILDLPSTLAAKRLRVMPTRPNLNIDDIIRHARRQHDTAPLALLAIDYVGLLETHDPKYPEDRIKISYATRKLKTLSQELSIPVVLVSQLNRKVDERTSKRPMLSDLRDSGSLEQDSDQVLFVYRPSAYNENDRPGEADLIVAKNRAGRTGDATVRFEGPYARFAALDGSAPPPAPGGVPYPDIPLPRTGG